MFARLSRLDTPTPEPTPTQHIAPAKSYATAVQQSKPNPTPQHLTLKGNTSPAILAVEPRKVLVRFSEEQERQRESKLSAKEIFQKVNEGRVNGGQEVE